MAGLLFVVAALGAVVVTDLVLENPVAGEATVFTQPVSGHSQGVLLAMAAAPAPEQAGVLDAWYGRHLTVCERGEPAQPTDLGHERSADGADGRPVTVTPGPTGHHPGSFHQRTSRAAHLRNQPDGWVAPNHQQPR